MQKIVLTSYIADCRRQEGAEDAFSSISRLEHILSGGVKSLYTSNLHNALLVEILCNRHGMTGGQPRGSED